MSRTCTKPLRCLRGLHTSRSNHAKEEGTIASVFASLSGEPIGSDLAPRFADLKRSLVTSPEHAESLKSAWRDVLASLKPATEQIARSQDAVIPTIELQPGDLAAKPLSDLVDSKTLSDIKYRGVVVLKGVVPSEQALEWKEQIKDYVKANPSVKGFPPENKQVFELYWSKPQIEARSHPRLLNATKSILQLFHSPHAISGQRTSLDKAISFVNPIVYADRLRIRLPGDSQFALGPHIDGGGIERWEDDNFRSFFKRILTGKCDWRQHDPWSMGDNGDRLLAKSDLYGTPGAASVLRPLQGWLSMSNTGPNEGTLRVLPLLHEATAYIMLRPFFRPITEENISIGQSYSEEFLDESNWTFDPTTSSFPGCTVGRTIELNDIMHPHLRLQQTMTSIPRVEPGDMVFWHSDVTHAVEAQHKGQTDSSVMYIPAIPTTKQNMHYLLQQTENFLNGIPPSDFPGGEGESKFVGRAQGKDVKGKTARRSMALELFNENEESTEEGKELLRYCNKLLNERMGVKA